MGHTADDGTHKRGLHSWILKRRGVIRIRREPQLNQDRIARMGVELALRAAQIIIRSKVGHIICKDGLLTVLPHERHGAGAQNGIADLVRNFAASLVEAQHAVRVGVESGIDMDGQEEMGAELARLMGLFCRGQVSVLGACEDSLDGLARMVEPRFEVV